jgi:hypothetical protein
MKRVFNYLMLVGIPLLGVMGVLRVGQSLPAMLCMHGPWTVETSQQATSPSCTEQRRQVEPLAFSISQSGPRLSISLDNERKDVLQGRIDDTDVIATVPHFSGTSFLTNETGTNIVELRATLDRQATPARLWGVLSFSKCPELKFVATHQPALSLPAR